MDVRRAVISGRMSSANLNNNADEWCESMARKGRFVDHTWFEMAAEMLDCDVCVIPLHPLPSNPCHIIQAGLLDHNGYGELRHGRNLPIFIGYFEDDKHSAGHFQSIVPYRHSEILQLIRDQGGPDVAQILDLPNNSGQHISFLILLSQQTGLLHQFIMKFCNDYCNFEAFRCRKHPRQSIIKFK